MRAVCLHAIWVSTAIFFQQLCIGNGLKCYVSKHDCFPACEGENDESDASEIKLESCSFVASGSGDFDWICNRTLSTCAESSKVNCTKGLENSEANEQECAPEETFCMEQYRRPQNSRHGKLPVWGFEAVAVRSCATSCTQVNQSMASGIGVNCCTTDLCNSSSRLTHRHGMFVLVALAMIFYDV